MHIECSGIRIGSCHFYPIIDAAVVCDLLLGSSILMELKKKKKSLPFGIRNKNYCFFILVVS